MYQEMIVRKLGLGSKFLRELLYVQQDRLRIELIKSKTTVAILAYKLYIRNIRAWSKIAKLIRMNEEAVTVECGKGNTKAKIKRISTNKRIWNE